VTTAVDPETGEIRGAPSKQQWDALCLKAAERYGLTVSTIQTALGEPSEYAGLSAKEIGDVAKKRIDIWLKENAGPAEEHSVEPQETEVEELPF